MKTMAIYEARSHFSEIVDEVVDGETTILTPHGSPVARIAPEPLDRAAVFAMIGDWFEYRNKTGITLGDLTIRELIDEGKR